MTFILFSDKRHDRAVRHPLPDTPGRAVVAQLDQADAAAVDQAACRVGAAVRFAWDDTHVTAAGEPVDRRAGGVLPSVQGVLGVDQRVGDIVA